MTKIEEKYIRIMKKKSGEERLKIAIALRKLVLGLAEAEIKDRNPGIFRKNLRQLLLKKIYGFSVPFEIDSK